MNNILPAIIAEDFNELKDKLKSVENLVNWVQIDIMDGKFVPPKTWYEPKELKDLETKLNMEVHLMVEHPEEKTEEWINSGVKRVLMHAESSEKESLKNMIDKLKSAGLEVGFAFKMETDFKDYEDIIPGLNMVQFMSISKIGYYGHPFNPGVVDKIRSFREAFPNVKVEVDGGVTKDSVKLLLDAGASNLAIGSAIFKSENIKDTILELQNL